MSLYSSFILYFKKNKVVQIPFLDDYLSFDFQQFQNVYLELKMIYIYINLIFLKSKHYIFLLNILYLYFYLLLFNHLIY